MQTNKVAIVLLSLLTAPAAADLKAVATFKPALNECLPSFAPGLDSEFDPTEEDPTASEEDKKEGQSFELFLDETDGKKLGASVDGQSITLAIVRGADASTNADDALYLAFGDYTAYFPPAESEESYEADTADDFGEVLLASKNGESDKKWRKFVVATENDITTLSKDSCNITIEWDGTSSKLSDALDGWKDSESWRDSSMKELAKKAGADEEPDIKRTVKLHTKSGADLEKALIMQASNLEKEILIDVLNSKPGTNCLIKSVMGAGLALVFVISAPLAPLVFLILGAECASHKVVSSFHSTTLGEKLFVEANGQPSTLSQEFAVIKIDKDGEEGLAWKDGTPCLLGTGCNFCASKGTHRCTWYSLRWRCGPKKKEECKKSSLASE